jgi:hypothetical protein
MPSMRPRVAALLAALPLALSLAACKTPEQKLVDRRHALRATLDRLYGSYGGSDLARPPPAEGGAAQDGGILGRALGEVDRSYFESQCLAVGRGERPFALSGKLDAFLRDERNAQECRRAADLRGEIDALERQVAGDGR